jgi:hypothetical protein
MSKTDIEQLLLSIMGLNGILLVQLLVLSGPQTNLNNKSRNPNKISTGFEAGFSSVSLPTMPSDGNDMMDSDTAPAPTTAQKKSKGPLSWRKKKRDDSDETLRSDMKKEEGKGNDDGAAVDELSISEDQKMFVTESEIVLSNDVESVNENPDDSFLLTK